MEYDKQELQSMQRNSEHVYRYFQDITINYLNRAKRFKTEKLLYYAEKHEVSYNEIVKLFEQGRKEGKRLLKAKKKKILQENVKFFLFELARKHNLPAHFVSANNKYHFRKGFGTDHDPEIAINAGKVIGEYEYVWKQVIRNHYVFEPFFQKLWDEHINSPLNKTPYPCENVEDFNLPDSMQIFKDFRCTLLELTNTLQIRNNEVLNYGFENLALYRSFSYKALRAIRKQSEKFLQEVKNNYDARIYESYKTHYRELINSLLLCIKELQAYEPFFDYDMSSFEDYDSFQENWFKFAYEMLKSLKAMYAEVTGSILLDAGIPHDYIEYWQQFYKQKEHVTIKKEYLKKEEVEMFLLQAFGGRPVKTKFYPKDITDTELRHAAWLFFDRFGSQYKFKKKDITYLMIRNFPDNFSQDPEQFENVNKNVKDYRANTNGKQSRIFQ